MDPYLSALFPSVDYALPIMTIIVRYAKIYQSYYKMANVLQFVETESFLAMMSVMTGTRSVLMDVLLTVKHLKLVLSATISHLKCLDFSSLIATSITFLL